MATKQEDATFANCTPFYTSQYFPEKLINTIAHLPGGTAPGPDGVYYEMLKAEPDSIAKVLQALWSACGILALKPKSWNEGTLIPLYKKGDPSLPAKYRPISLLSAVRKVSERTIANAVQTVFIPSSMQLGYQRKLGTEMAIVQAIATIKGGNAWAAVVDLKAAYDSVPRDKLFHMCAKKFPPNMVAKITNLVQPLTVKTSGEPLQTIRKK